MHKPRLTNTVMLGLHSLFNSCDLAHFPELFRGQPLEDQQAQIKAAHWVRQMQVYRDQYKRPAEPSRTHQRKPD